MQSSPAPECLKTLRELSAKELADGYQGVDQHRQRLQFEVRSVQPVDHQLDHLLRQSFAIPKRVTG